MTTEAHEALVERIARAWLESDYEGAVKYEGQAAEKAKRYARNFLAMLGAATGEPA